MAIRIEETIFAIRRGSDEVIPPIYVEDIDPLYPILQITPNRDAVEDHRFFGIIQS